MSCKAESLIRGFMGLVMPNAEVWSAHFGSFKRARVAVIAQVPTVRSVHHHHQHVDSLRRRRLCG